MWKLLVVLSVVLTPNLFAEHDGSEGGQRQQVTPVPRKSPQERLQEFCNSCGSDCRNVSVGGQPAGSSPSTTPNGDAPPPGTSTGSSSGAQIFADRCLKCHKTGGQGKILSSATDFQNAVERVNSTDPARRMPKDGPLSDADKQAVLAHLSQLGASPR